MTDREAVQLANLIAAYARASYKEGASLAEVKQYTLAAVCDDIVMTTPGDLAFELDAEVLRLSTETP